MRALTRVGRLFFKVMAGVRKKVTSVTSSEETGQKPCCIRLSAVWHKGNIEVT